MRVHKPKVEYKLALQEKPQGSILTYYDKTNNLTRINWLNTRLIIANNKIRHEIPLKQKESNTQRFERNLLKYSKKASYLFVPRFPPQFFCLHHNFNIFPHFYCFPSSSSSSSFLLFSLLLLILIVFPPPPPPPQLPSSNSSMRNVSLLFPPFVLSLFCFLNALIQLFDIVESWSTRLYFLDSLHTGWHPNHPTLNFEP